MSEFPELPKYQAPVADLERLIRTSVEALEGYDAFDFLTMPECIAEWNKKIPICGNETSYGIINHYVFNEEDVAAFLDAINKIVTDRILADMVKKGLLELSHNGTDFCFDIPKKPA